MNKGLVRLLSIAAIIALFGASWYSLFNESGDKAKRYNEYLSVARQKAHDGIYDDARDNYMSALNMFDSIGLRDEIAQFYLDIKQTGNYANFCSDMIVKYPYEAVGYERMAKYYMDMSDYYTFFNLITTAQKRKISSSVLDTYVEEIAYKYEVTTVAFDEVRDFASGYCAVKRADGYWGYINPYGTTVLRYVYLDADSFAAAGLAAVKTQEDERYKLIDGSGRIKSVDTQDRNIEDCASLISEKIAVKYDGKYHYCDSDLNELFGAYDYAGAFWCGVAAVQDNGNWYIIDESGNKVTDKVFEDIKVDDRGIAYRNDVAFAKINGSYILVDTKGNQIGSQSWDDADAFNSDQPAAVKKGGLWGFVDLSGNEVVSCQYEGAKSFSNGFAAVQRGGKWGYIAAGSYDEAIECTFQDANDFSDGGSAFVYANDRWTLIKVYRLSKVK